MTKNPSGVLVGIVASGVLVGCNVFEARSGDLECLATPDCARDRVCESGYCVDPGFTPDADPNAPDADPNAPDARDGLDGGNSNCWDSAWSERTKLVFQNSGQSSNLSDVPVLVTLNSGNFDYSKAQDAGQDLRFVDSDGTPLPHEIEEWNESGNSFVWFKVPQIDGGSNTDFVHMYYGNAAAPDAQSKSAVWTAAYQAVWHLNETTGPHVDSAKAISCAWTGPGSGTQDAVGRIGGANSFDGESANCGTGAIPSTTGSTITAWLRLPMTGDNNQAVVSFDSTSSPFSGVGLYVQRTTGALGTWHNSGYQYASSGSSLISTDAWTFVALRSTQASSGGSIEVSTNGGSWETIASGDTNDLQVPANTPLVLGKWPGGGPSADIEGLLDEVRISGVSRSDDWIRAQHLSMSDGYINLAADPQVCE